MPEETVQQFWDKKLDIAMAKWQGSRYKDTEELVLSQHIALKRAYHHIQTLYEQNEKWREAFSLILDYIKQREENEDSKTLKIREEISTAPVNESEAVRKLD